MIGWTPQQVDDMSLWQFRAAAEGYREAHAPAGKAQSLTDEEFRSLSNLIDEPPMWVN